MKERPEKILQNGESDCNLEAAQSGSVSFLYLAKISCSKQIIQNQVLKSLNLSEPRFPHLSMHPTAPHGLFLPSCVLYTYSACPYL